MGQSPAETIFSVRSETSRSSCIMARMVSRWYWAFSRWSEMDPQVSSAYSSRPVTSSSSVMQPESRRTMESSEAFSTPASFRLL